MKSQVTNQVMTVAKHKVLRTTIALSALFTVAGLACMTAPSASAASLQACGSFGQQYVMQGLGPDGDSLLPPEVVPLDSTAGASYQAASQSQAAQMNPYTPPSAGQQSYGGAPGSSSAMSQASPQAPAQAMQSSQEWRKQAFDSLMNNPNAQPVFGTQQAQMANANGTAPGQSGWTGANGQPVQGAVQSQTLTGQAQQQSMPKKNSGPSKIAGVAHTASMLTMFGSGALTGALMTRSYSPLGFYGPGLMGAGMVNYGLRNSFSRW